MNEVRVAQYLCPSAAHTRCYTQMYPNFPDSCLCHTHSHCPKWTLDSLPLPPRWLWTAVCFLLVASVPLRLQLGERCLSSARGRGHARKQSKAILSCLNQRSNRYTYTGSLYPASLKAWKTLAHSQPTVANPPTLQVEKRLWGTWA